MHCELSKKILAPQEHFPVFIELPEECDFIIAVNSPYHTGCRQFVPVLLPADILLAALVLNFQQSARTSDSDPGIEHRFPGFRRATSTLRLFDGGDKIVDFR